MNFLAHLLLSGSAEKVIVGNYVGDFVKGSLAKEKTAEWDQEFLLGLRLHRYIDYYTDDHPVVRETRKILSDRFPKVSGIIIDIYFDYFLAKNFKSYSSELLPDFAQRMYSIFRKREDMIPVDMGRMVNHMIAENWLAGYANYDGIEVTFQRMSRRTPYLKILDQATAELFGNEEIYEGKFNAFFPQLMIATANFMQHPQE